MLRRALRQNQEEKLELETKVVDLTNKVTNLQRELAERIDNMLFEAAKKDTEGNEDVLEVSHTVASTGDIQEYLYFFLSAHCGF